MIARDNGRRITRISIFLLLACGALQLQAAAPDMNTSLQAAKRSAEKAPRTPFIPRDSFMMKATVSEVSMSPGGRWLAYRRGTSGPLELWLREIADGNDYRIMPDSEGTEVLWSGDEARLWLSNKKGVGVFDISSKAGRRILRFDEARQQIFWMVDPNAADFALLREKLPADGAWLYRYIAIDSKGKTRVVLESRRALLSALLDADGELRYAAGYDGAAFDTVLWKFHGNDRKELMRCPLPEQCRPVAYAENTVWALAHNGENLMSLQRLSVNLPDAESIEWQTLHKDPRGIADAVSILMQPDGSDWLATAYRPGRVEWYGRTTGTDAALAALQAELPGANLDISPSSNGKRWLVRALKASWSCDRHFLYDVTARMLSPLFEEERCSALATEQLADALPVHWRGKDGMALHGYVYLPKGIPLETAPLIAFIHGGPYARSLGEADPGAQLMVNRGYVVFKPNFRASTGYGVHYVRAARGDFGKEGVLDDIITGLDYLIANGIGNAKQQAVVGHSFGGYASLLAVTHHPNRFAFAVPSAAPVDMAWTMADIAIEGGSALSVDGPPIEVLFPGYGVPYQDKAWHERMRRESPLTHADELRTPVYLWAGAKDDRVAVEGLVRYFSESNKDFTPTLLIDPDAGHSPRERLNVEALAWLIEASADRHFEGGVTPPSAALNTFLEKNLRPAKGPLLSYRRSKAQAQEYCCHSSPFESWPH